IPKGGPDEGEELEASVHRETWDEAGVRAGGTLTTHGADYYRDIANEEKAVAGRVGEVAEGGRGSGDTEQYRVPTLEKQRQAPQLLHPDQRVFLDRLLDSRS